MELVGKICEPFHALSSRLKHSTAVAFVLLTRQPQVRISTLPKFLTCIYELSAKVLLRTVNGFCSNPENVEILTGRDIGDWCWWRLQLRSCQPPRRAW